MIFMPLPSPCCVLRFFEVVYLCNPVKKISIYTNTNTYCIQSAVSMWINEIKSRTIDQFVSIHVEVASISVSISDFTTAGTTL